jgi:AP-1 complex subunit mu
MAASAVFILDLKGHVILFRDYRGDVPIKYAERFITKLNELEEAGKVNLSRSNSPSHVYVTPLVVHSFHRRLLYPGHAR